MIARAALKLGKDADIVIFNDDFTAWGTLINGRWTVEPGLGAAL